MKKIHLLLLTSIFTLFFTLSANAQEKNDEIKIKSQEQVDMLGKKLQLTTTQKDRTYKALYELNSSLTNSLKGIEREKKEATEKKIKHEFLSNMKRILDDSQLEKLKQYYQKEM